MKDYLKDLIDHTHGLGCIELIKVTGTETETAINAVAEDKSVIVSGSFKNPISDFIGVFGMPNLSKLKTIIGFDEYDEHAKINVTRTPRDGEEVPSTIHFETKTGELIQWVLKEPTVYTKHLNLQITSAKERLIPYNSIIPIVYIIVISEEDVM